MEPVRFMAVFLFPNNYSFLPDKLRRAGRDSIWLYSWIHLFIDHYSAFVSALDRISSISEKAVTSVEDHDTFIDDFFQRFRFHFLQHKTTSCSPPHSPSDAFPGGRT
ncbi:MAG: hypothetical protein J5965_09540 [Aeriscardovia sp.]|nr:hypothetical protein [Aeriscardovia sp.]